jgi:hypothetical protein
MVPSRFVRQLLFVLYLSMIVAGVFAQAVASAEFDPNPDIEKVDVADRPDLERFF